MNGGEAAKVPDGKIALFTSHKIQPREECRMVAADQISL
jgi:hypothetical protein